MAETLQERTLAVCAALRKGRGGPLMAPNRQWTEGNLVRIYGMSHETAGVIATEHNVFLALVEAMERLAKTPETLVNCPVCWSFKVLSKECRKCGGKGVLAEHIGAAIMSDFCDRAEAAMGARE